MSLNCHAFVPPPQEVQRLQSENLRALETKKELEDLMIAAGSKLEGMEQVRVKGAMLENLMIAAGSKLEGMEQVMNAAMLCSCGLGLFKHLGLFKRPGCFCILQASESLQAELESLRTQSMIWKSDNSNEQDKIKQENTLLRSQLQTR